MPSPRLGVNFTPRKDWFHSWLDLDPASITDDMAQIAELGLDHVRLFPLWPLLQPSPTLISRRAVDDLLRVADIAGEHGLEVSVDLLQGHLSSFDFLPSWVTTWHRRGIFTDASVIAAQSELARTVGSALAERPFVTGMTLGNEIGQFAGAHHPDPYPVTSAGATAWTRSLLETLEGAMPGRRHHHCFDDALWFSDAHPFTPADAVQLGASTTVHSWAFTGAGQALGADHPGLALFGRYLVEVADAWARRLGLDGRAIWLQEIGAPTPWVSPERAADFARESIRAAASHPRVEAITWWCSHDVSRSLADFPEVEYTLGLFDEAGAVKPVGRAIGRCAADLAEIAEGPADAAHGARSEPLVVDGIRADGSDRSRLAPTGPVFSSWVEEALAGNVRPLALRG